jgi:hypothetical protein
MKDAIIDACPTVIGILLNYSCHRYGKNGVHYVEFSVSSGDLLDANKFKNMDHEIFTDSQFKVDMGRATAKRSDSSSKSNSASLSAPARSKSGNRTFDANDLDALWVAILH